MRLECLGTAILEYKFQIELEKREYLLSPW